MINISNTFFKKMNLYAIWFLVTFGLLLQISASSVQGLNQYNDNFYFIIFNSELLFTELKPKTTY